VLLLRVDEVHLTRIILGERTGRWNAIGCAGRGPDPAIEPSRGLCNGAALRLRRGAAGGQQLRQLGLSLLKLDPVRRSKDHSLINDQLSRSRRIRPG